MRVRTPDSERQRTAGAGPTTASRLRGLVRHLLTAIGLLTVTYAVLRVLGPRDNVPVQSVDEARDEMEDVLPDGITDRAADAVPDDPSIDSVRNRLQATDHNITQTTIDGPRSEASEFDPGVSPSEGDENGSDGSDVTGLSESGETTPDAADSDAVGSNESETGASSGNPIDGVEANADYADDDRSDEEIAERADPDAGDAPAEPGEMAVDESVAENLVDDESDADESEE